MMQKSQIVPAAGRGVGISFVPTGTPVLPLTSAQLVARSRQDRLDHRAPSSVAATNLR